MSTNYDLVDISLNILRWARIHPYQNKLGIYIAIIICLMRVIYIYLALIIILREHETVSEIIKATESVISFSHAVPKLIIIFFLRKKLKFLIGTLDQFWNGTERNVYNFWKRFLYMYRTLAVLTLFVFIAISIITKKLIYVCWVPNIHNSFIILMIGQYIEITMDALSILGFDMFFIAICIVIKQQFILLKIEIKTFNAVPLNTLENKYKKIIKHHNFLLRYSNVLIETYTYPLLMQYVLSGISICVQLFNILERTEMFGLLASFLSIAIFISQLACYCFPASEVSIAAEQVSFYLYSTQWYDTPVHLQKYLPLVISRSQKPLTFTAGGMAVINREAFTNVFKNGLSFYMVIKNLK